MSRAATSAAPRRAAAMLSGRESLVRLIGRRRRPRLPASLAAALSPSPPFPSASLAQVEVKPRYPEPRGTRHRLAYTFPFSCRTTTGADQEKRRGETWRGGSGSWWKWVACPVCGESIRGSDYCVNAHLDMCLARVSKRKLTQSTLLNFRFSKKVSAEPMANSLNEDEAENMNQIDEYLCSDQAFFSLHGGIGSSRSGANISSPTCLNGPLGTSETINTYEPLITVLPNAKDAVNDGAVERCSSSTLPTVATSCSIDACADMDSSTAVAVGTVIVWSEVP